MEEFAVISTVAPADGDMHNKTLRVSLVKAYGTSKHCELTLSCESTTYHVHKVMLSTLSDFLDRACNCGPNVDISVKRKALKTISNLI